MGGDKIVLLDGAGANGGGAATNGLLSMIPGMFANLIGGNKMDPNLVAALMNGRNNQDGFGGANGWWLWIIVLFWLWGGRGFGNGFGNGGDCCANGLPAQLNNDYGSQKRWTEMDSKCTTPTISRYCRSFSLYNVCDLRHEKVTKRHTFVTNS